MILDAFLNETFTLCVTTDILAEYEEIAEHFLSEKIASNLLQLIENAPNVEWITSYYKWNLIEADADDNKFVDCAIASNSICLVGNDKHFNILKNVPFPRVEVLNATDFCELLQTYSR